ncbi:hypothetical protein [Flavobacterium defluvii]|uniref:Chaperone of endosialidase n=1 Tax=Flavobacterium defluvii TaxID=370979 RepID=A0A1M5WKK3_9FLAO|nr:hypothetical protein [Flavobacterium defluvii]SHH87958.1 hypothetical protein SAMN05443663_11440 [Flavobacterium defluvii]
MKFYLTLITLFFFGFISSAQQIGDGYAPATISDFSAPLKSGIYNGLNTSTIGMAPDNSNVWQHLFAARHISTTNNYQLQIASSFTVNDRLFFRKIIASDLSSSNSNWVELATRTTNTFSGNQIVNGTIGIGVTSSISPLDLVSNSSAQGIVIRKRTANDYGNILFYDNAGSTGLGGIGIATANRIRIMNGGVGDSFERFTITSAGLIGINSTSPLNTFEVKVPSSTGTSSVDGISIHDGGTYRLGINIGINTAGEYSFLQAIKGGIGQRNIIMNPTGGNVGIGITNPTNKLDVNGTIHSKEVKVDLTGWSDFVFKKDYDLPTLQEVEKHINEKGHLENIPSEEEVLKNGINLGEMNSKLLQKIEELTLYSIQQNKKIEEQAKEIETLKALALRIEKIEKELSQK